MLLVDNVDACGGIGAIVVVVVDVGNDIIVVDMDILVVERVVILCVDAVEDVVVVDKDDCVDDVEDEGEPG